MKEALIFFLSLALTKESAAQRNIKPCKDTVEANVLSYNPSESFDLLKDSLTKNLKLVFEQHFNDTISIFVNDRLFKIGFFKTAENLGVCPNTVSIDYSAFKGVPNISIVLHSKNGCISFYPREDKRIAYITCIEGGWSVDLSNVMRRYR
jgi:hypothetical protein